MSTWLARFRAWVVAAFGRSRLEAGMDEEIRFHLEQYTADLVARGIAPGEAARQARAAFGQVPATKDWIRDALGLRPLDELRLDVAYGLRQLRRAPGFTTVTLLSLGLGIGASTAIFTLVNAVFLRTLPVGAPHELVQVTSIYPGEPRIPSIPWRYYEHYRDHGHAFSDLMAVTVREVAVSGGDLDGAGVMADVVSGNFFSGLGLDAPVGRLIAPADDRAGASAAVAVLGWPFWQRAFGGSPGALGGTLTIDGVPTTIVGVAPRGFSGPVTGMSPDVYLPIAFETLTRRSSEARDGSIAVGILGRLAPGVTIEQARAELQVLDGWRRADLAARSGDPQWAQATLDLAPAATGFSLLRDRFRTPLLLLMTIVGLLLLLACTNIAGLFVARGAARRQEMAVRSALGAGRGRLLRQALTEALLLAGAGAGIGVALAYAGAGALLRAITSGRPMVGWSGPIELPLAPDGRVLGFTALVAIAAALLFGVAPLLSGQRAPASVLRLATVSGDPLRQRRFGHALVVAQIALSMVLLTAAAVLSGHLARLRSQGLGFNPRSVLVVVLNPQGSGLDRGQLTAAFHDLLDRLSALPGVESATLAAVTPIEGGAASRFVSVEGAEVAPAERRRVMLNWVAPRYFETTGTRLVSGRDFSFADQGRAHVAIVNEALAARYFPGASPLGRQLTLEGETARYEVVGVVADAKYVSVREPAPPTLYLSAFQDGRIGSHFAIRTSVPPLRIGAEVRAAVAARLPGVRVSKMTTFADQVDASIVRERVVALLSTTFAVLGLLLAAVGLYGLLAYTVTRRTREIGIRMALGATRGETAAMVLRGVLGLVAAGLALGVPLAMWGQRLAGHLLDTSVSPGPSLAVGIGALLAGAFVAAYVPVRRATRIDPASALRQN